MCLQAMAAPFGIWNARRSWEWEATQETVLLRAGAVIASAAGGSRLDRVQRIHDPRRVPLSGASNDGREGALTRCALRLQRDSLPPIAPQRRGLESRIKANGTRFDAPSNDHRATAASFRHWVNLLTFACWV